MKNLTKGILAVLIVDALFCGLSFISAAIFSDWIASITVLISQFYLTVVAAFYMIKGIYVKGSKMFLTGAVIGVTTLIFYLIAYLLAYYLGTDDTLPFGIAVALYVLRKWAIGFALFMGALVLFDAAKSLEK